MESINYKELVPRYRQVLELEFQALLSIKSKDKSVGKEVEKLKKEFDKIKSSKGAEEVEYNKLSLIFAGLAKCFAQVDKMFSRGDIVKGILSQLSFAGALEDYKKKLSLLVKDSADKSTTQVISTKLSEPPEEIELQKKYFEIKKLNFIVESKLKIFRQIKKTIEMMGKSTESSLDSVLKSKLKDSESVLKKLDILLSEHNSFKSTYKNRSKKPDYSKISTDFEKRKNQLKLNDDWLTEIILNCVPVKETAYAESIQTKLKQYDPLLVKELEYPGPFKLELEKISNEILIEFKYCYPNLVIEKPKSFSLGGRASVIGQTFSRLSIGGEGNLFSFATLRSRKLSNFEQESDKKIEDYSTLATQAKVIQDQITKTVITGFDYQFLNAIAYISTTGKTVSITYLDQPLEKWFEMVGNLSPTLQETIKKFETISNLTERAKAILQHVNAKDFLPDTWLDEQKYVADGDLRFPSSANGHLEGGWSAHRDGDILASAGPSQSRFEADSAAYFKFVLKYKIGLSLVMRGYGKDSYDYYLLLQNQKITVIDPATQAKVTYSFSVTKGEGKESWVTVSNGIESHSYLYNRLVIQDNDSIYFSPENFINFKILLTLFKKIIEDLNGNLHCHAGMGRTGQLKWIYKIYREWKTNENFRKTLDALILNSKLTSGELDSISKTCIQLLYDSRKIRYSVQDQKQKNSIIPFIILLRASELKIASNVMEKMHNVLYIGDKPRPSLFDVHVAPDPALLDSKQASSLKEESVNNNSFIVYQ